MMVSPVALPMAMGGCGGGVRDCVPVPTPDPTPFFQLLFSMAFHGVPFFWSQNASRETVPISVFLLSHVSSTLDFLSGSTNP
jgi:hypothetical protein